MNFDMYWPFKNKEGKMTPGVVAKPTSYKDMLLCMSHIDVVSSIQRFRDTGDDSYKKSLPAWTPMGRSKTGKRLRDAMIPTQFVMIDIDHCEDVKKSAEDLKWKIQEKHLWDFILLLHITPSGKGLRLVCLSQPDLSSIREQVEWYCNTLELSKYGKIDELYDYSRLSFLPQMSDVIYHNDVLGMRDGVTGPLKELEVGTVSHKTVTAPSAVESGVQPFSESEVSQFETSTYRGIPMKLIVEKYVEVFGTPGSGEIHNYYNEMVKNFRCICDNNKRWLLYVLPSFGHSITECWSQIVSICRVNTLSSLPRKFYFFLKDNGFYEYKGKRADDLMGYMLDTEAQKPRETLPWMPPVLRDIVKSAPADFVLPTLSSLLPILGTLTSYLGAQYPYDGRIHTTSFFTVVYAPAGTGKGFCERFIDMLFRDLKLRDLVSSERENLYLQVVARKGANDKSPEMPHVSLRIIPAKNSEAEFLQKQRDNHGYHMFTYAAEMDSWSKGVRAAGGNKDDMIRIAWDNGEYGQQFRSANTFKGMVRLYWNVLITGTIAQVEQYFKNVENGLVTRCSFCGIENQEFAMPAKWRALNEKSKKTINSFLARCDLNTYETACDASPDDFLGLSAEDFDKRIDWRFQFRERVIVDMDWLMPVIDEFNKEQLERAALDIDRARDVFRRRVAVRGFRLGMMCYAFWDKPRKRDLEKCIPFIKWWMEHDLEESLKLWGSRYNALTDTTPQLTQRNVFVSLNKEFTREDVYAVCTKQGIKTPVRRVIYDWKRLGYVEEKGKNLFAKKS